MHFDAGLFTCQVPPESDQSPSQRYRELLEIAPLLESCGFEKLWVSEHHFAEDSYLPGVLPFCAALGVRTTDIRIGTGIALAPFYEPLRFAEDSAVIDLITNGRFEPGLAIGWIDAEFEAFGIPKEFRVQYLIELVDIMRAAWTEGEFSYAGNIHEYEAVNVHPKPVQDHVPIWIAGTVDAAVKRAANIADGYFATPTPTDELVRRQSLFCQEADNQGKNGLAEWRYAYISENEPWEESKQHIWYIKRQYIEWATGEPQPYELPSAMEADLKEECLVGTPAEVREQVTERRDRLGDDYRLVARLTLPGLAGKHLRRSITLFSEAVIEEIE